MCVCVCVRGRRGGGGHMLLGTTTGADNRLYMRCLRHWESRWVVPSTPSRVDGSKKACGCDCTPGGSWPGLRNDKCNRCFHTPWHCSFMKQGGLRGVNQSRMDERVMTWRTNASPCWTKPDWAGAATAIYRDARYAWSALINNATSPGPDRYPNELVTEGRRAPNPPPQPGAHTCT